MRHFFKELFFLPLLIFVAATSLAFVPVGSKQTLGTFKKLSIEAFVQSPSLQETPLQVICLFEYSEGDIFNSPPALSKEFNGLVHIDEAFKGLLTDLRKTHKFEGKLLETLLITPPKGTVAAKKLLLIGLGNRNDFKPEIMRLIGLTGMREALRLEVSSYSHASDLKDAGIDSPTQEVAGKVIQGAIEAYQVQEYLQTQKMAGPLSVSKVTLLAGPAYFEESKEGIQKVLSKTLER